MPRRTASLLTKTQRRRLDNDFADLDEDKTRRDQQQVRDRLRAGLQDCRLLADYPDRQLVLALDDLDDDERRAALADTYLLVERLRELHGYDRDDLVADARARSEELAGDEDALSLQTLDLQTPTEIREATRGEMLDRLGASRWQRRANGLIKVAGAAFLPLFLILHDNGFGDGSLARSVDDGLLSLAIFVGVLSLFTGLSILGVRALKRDVVPSLLALARDPAGTVRQAWDRL